MENQNRQLAAILFSDIVGYTAMMQQDEKLAVSVNQRYGDVLKQSVSMFAGTILNDYGDGSLCTFTSATLAVKCAMELQKQLQLQPRVPLRIGLHIGEIFFEGGKVFGDGVNIASRIESLGQANSILFSSEINSKLRNQQDFTSVSLGRFHFKNVEEPLEVFALANDGFSVPDKKKMEGKLQKSKSTRKSLIIGIFLMAILIVAGYFAYHRFLQASISAGEKSIAVIPFRDIGISTDNISEGLVEDILVHLSKISELKKVISNRSSSRYANSPKNPAEIGAELNVNTVVMGSIQQIGDTIVVNVQLIDCKSGNTLWADRYTKEKRQIFDLETELATKIVNELKAKLSSNEAKGFAKHGTDNVEAYKLYRKGRYFWSRGSRENFDSAEANYLRALELDPDYALAYTGLADCHIYNFRGSSQLQEIPLAKIYTTKALSIDSTLSEALTTLGFIQQNFEYAWSPARINLKKAVQYDPNNSTAHMYYGLALMNSTNDVDVALQELEKAVDLDPLATITNWNLARNYYFASHYDKAINQFNRLSSLASNKQQKYLSIWCTGLVYLKEGLFPQAKENFDQLPQGDSAQLDNYQIMQSYAYAVMGEKTTAKNLLEKTIKKYPNLSHYRNSQVYVALGDFTEALRQLKIGYDNRDVHMFWIRMDPAFDPIRNEPGFKLLLKNMNLE